jgi:DNA-binding IclR family transcriptional regulator
MRAPEDERMAHTYEELKKKTIEDLREIAKGLDHEAVQGYSQMNKDHLLPAVCKALGIDVHRHHDAVGIDKAKLKARMRELRAEKEKALEARDGQRLKAIRREYHHLNRRIRAASV